MRGLVGLGPALVVAAPTGARMVWVLVGAIRGIQGAIQQLLEAGKAMESRRLRPEVSSPVFS